jgi:hypothetical protein
MEHLRTVGRAVALVGCLATAVSWLWVLVLALWFQGDEANLGLTGVAAFMVILGIAGVHAALAEAHGVMYALALVWWFPYGYYLTGSGAWYIGLSNLLYLLGAILLHLGGRLDHREHLPEGP